MEARSVGRMTGWGSAGMVTSFLPTLAFLFFREYREHMDVKFKLKLKIKTGFWSAI
jgi:hypothetical protein